MVEAVNLEAQEAMEERDYREEIRGKRGERRCGLVFVVQVVGGFGCRGLVLEPGAGSRDGGKGDRQGTGLRGGEKVSEDVGGDGVGVMAVGQDAAAGPAPQIAAELVLGQGLSELEEGFPMVIPKGETLR